MTMKILEDFDDGDNVDIAKVQRPLPIGLFFCFIFNSLRLRELKKTLFFIILFSVLSDDLNDVCNADGDADYDVEEEGEGDVNDFDDVDAHASFPSSLIYSSKDKEF